MIARALLATFNVGGSAVLLTFMQEVTTAPTLDGHAEVGDAGDGLAMPDPRWRLGAVAHARHRLDGGFQGRSRGSAFVRHVDLDRFRASETTRASPAVALERCTDADRSSSPGAFISLCGSSVSGAGKGRSVFAAEGVTGPRSFLIRGP